VPLIAILEIGSVCEFALLVEKSFQMVVMVDTKIVQRNVLLHTE
jgi:hypothetical protein